jgi:hypothetical protein
MTIELSRDERVKNIGPIEGHDCIATCRVDGSGFYELFKVTVSVILYGRSTHLIIEATHADERNLTRPRVMHFACAADEGTACDRWGRAHHYWRTDNRILFTSKTLPDSHSQGRSNTRSNVQQAMYKKHRNHKSLFCFGAYVGSIKPFASDSFHQSKVLGHDSLSLCMHGAEVGVFKQVDHKVLNDLLQTG